MPVRNIVTIAVAAIIALSCAVTSSRNRLANLFAEGVSIVERDSLIVKDRRALFDSAMDGMLRSLDPNSRFLSGKAYQEFQEEFQQEFGGVGIYTDIDPTTGRLTVLAPMKDRPAARAGVRAGDVILSIDGRSTEELTRLEAIELMRGPPATKVAVELQRGEEIFAVALDREIIPMRSVHGDWINRQGDWEFTVDGHPHLGYVRLSMFANQSSEELRQVLESLKDRVSGLILDLRNNGGGLLPGAVEVCDMFLPDSLMIVQIKGRTGNVLESYFSSGTAVVSTKLPLVVLVNRHSASASEIVAAALQDHQRATVIGEQTFGKGTVQNVIPLEPGRSVMKLTVARYSRPSNRNIDRDWARTHGETQWGVLPNPGFEVELSEAQVFEEYRQRLQKEIRGLNAAQGQPDSQPVPQEPPAATDAPALPGLPDAHRQHQADTLVEDLPLRRAVEFLNSITMRTVAK